MFKRNNLLRYCFIDISTATNAGKTSIRVHPAEGFGVFFTDVVRDLNIRRGDIEEIIKEAKDAKDRVRIIITRQSRSTKSIREYVKSKISSEEMYNEILIKSKKLASQIKYHDIRENYDLFKEVKEFAVKQPKPNLEDLVKLLNTKGIKSRYFDNQLDILDNHSNIYKLSNQKWNEVNWREA